MAALDKYINRELISDDFNKIEEQLGTLYGGREMVVNGALYRVEDTGRGTRILKKIKDENQLAQERIQNEKQKLIDQVTKMAESQQKKVDDFLKNNPFAYDDAWLQQTRQQVQQEVDSDPYYKEKITDYINDVETKKSRAQEDQATLLKELKKEEDYYLKNDKINFQETRSAALEGQSQAGYLDSGMGSRERNIQNIQHEAGVESYLGKNDSTRQAAQQATSRLLSDLGTQQGRYEREVGREKQLNVESELLNRKDEKLQQYQSAFQKATGQIFPGYNAYLGQ